jgi:hypothetical protein
MIDKPEPRRFPPPWIAEETDAYFIVRDANGHALAYVYFEEELDRRSAAKLLTPRRVPAHRRQHRQAAGAVARAAADKRGVTRLQPHISRQSAQFGLDPSPEVSPQHTI